MFLMAAIFIAELWYPGRLLNQNPLEVYRPLRVPLSATLMTFAVVLIMQYRSYTSIHIRRLTVFLTAFILLASADAVTQIVFGRPFPPLSSFFVGATVGGIVFMYISELLVQYQNKRQRL